MATITVHQYSTRQDSKRDWIGWGNLSYLVIAETDWTLTITRNGEVIFRERIDDEEAMPIDQLAGQQVQDVLEDIPVCQTAPAKPPTRSSEHISSDK